MPEIDPFTTKVADVYDTRGRRVGSLRAPDYSGFGCLLAVAAVIAVIVGAVWLVVAGGLSVKNLIRHGEFTTDTVAAEVRDHEDDPNYFTKRAKSSKMRIIRTRVTVEDTGENYGNPDVVVYFSVENGSSDDHVFGLDVHGVVVKAVVDGRTRTLHLGCGRGDQDITLPAGRIMGEFYADLCDRPDIKYTKLALVHGPSIGKIDRLPVSGGPANTDWYGASHEHGGGK